MIKQPELEKINKLVAVLDKVKNFCSYLPPNVIEKCKIELRIDTPRLESNKYLTVDAKIIAPALLDYENKIKRQLRELEYEPD